MATAALLPAGPRATVLAGWFDDDALERGGPRGARAGSAIRFLGRVTRDEVLDAIHSARCGLVIDHPISNYLESYSTKMFEYMACGVPVVCSDFPLWVRLVDRRRLRRDRGPDRTRRPSPRRSRRCAATPTEARRLGENGRRAILRALQLGERVREARRASTRRLA